MRSAARLADAGLEWSAVETAYTGTATTAMGLSRLMYRHLGASGISMAQVENASASGSTAVRQACIDVAAGLADVAIAVGVDKPLKFAMPHPAAKVRDLVGSRVAPFTHFALLANRYIHDHGATPEQFGMVAVKNSRNGAVNPNAQRQKARTLDEVMAPPLISGPLTRLQCCPVGEGAAAVIVASDDAISRLGLDASRAVRVLASVARSETVYRGRTSTPRSPVRPQPRRSPTPASPPATSTWSSCTTRSPSRSCSTSRRSASRPRARLLRSSPNGSSTSVDESPSALSGGLLSMGHPIGPTGVGQICELTTQLRGEGGERQHPGARTGVAHMVGVGAVCVVHVLHAP